MIPASINKAGNITEILKRNYDNNGVPSSLISQDTFTYEQNGWNDRLTKFNNDEISYDLNGNPLLYRDGMQFTWVNGRRLKTILYNGNTYAMSYDTNGMRTQKGNTHYYYDSGNNLVGMTDGTHTLLFYYDENGSPIAFSYNGVMYYYIKNLQGDVMKIVNYNGVTIASYSYDVSGKVLSVKNSMGYDVTNSAAHIGNLNPYRYRSYIYDYETGLYYLKSRYYDPEVGRFINADIYCDTSSNIFGTNMFAYCNDNFVNQIDPNGTDAYWLQFGDAVFGFGHTSLLLQDASNNWWYFYWSGLQAVLRPCGKDDFLNYNQVYAFLCGFDPRSGHNYYVYANNVYYDEEDINGALGSDYYVKCHDKSITGWIHFEGNFSNSFSEAVSLLKKLYCNSNATQLEKRSYNGKFEMYQVCRKVYKDYVSLTVFGYIIFCYLPSGFYYENIEGNNKEAPTYSLTNNNCVQVSVDLLLKGTFYGFTGARYQQELTHIKGWSIPNNCYKYLIQNV